MAQWRIYKDSWHYRYWSFLRNLWGVGELRETEGRQITSLCPYCHTMLWLSVVTVLLFLPMLLGWLLAKLFRWLYKLGEKAEKHGQFGHRFVDAMDKMKVGESLEKVGDKMTESPAVAGVFFFFGCIATVFIMAGFVLIALIGVGKFIWNFPWIIGWFFYGIYWAVTELGWLIIWLLSWVGWALVYVVEGLVWLFTNGALWLTIGQWALAIVLGLIACFLVCYVVTAILTSKPLKRFWKRVSFRFNGFVEAREKASKRRCEQAVIIKEKIKKGELPPPKPSKIGHYWGIGSDVAWRTVVTVWAAGSIAVMKTSDTFMEFFVSEEEYDAETGKTKKILSPARIVWEYLVAFKHGVCPIVEFSDERPEPEYRPQEEVADKKDGSTFGGTAEVEVNTGTEANPTEKIGGEFDASVATEAETNASQEIGGEADTGVATDMDAGISKKIGGEAEAEAEDS